MICEDKFEKSAKIFPYIINKEKISSFDSETPWNYQDLCHYSYHIIILLSDLGYETSKIFIWLFSPNLINEVLRLELQQLKGMWQGVLKR